MSTPPLARFLACSILRGVRLSQNWYYHNQLNNKEKDNKNFGIKNIRKHKIKWKDFDFILSIIYFNEVKIPDIR